MEDVNIFFFVKLFLTSLVFIFVPLRIIATKKRSKNSSVSVPSLPPGPWKLPVVGNLHQLVGHVPHHRMRDLARKHGPLMRLQLGELPHVVVSSAEVASAMMRTHDANFSQRPSSLVARFYDSKNIVFIPYGDHWRQLRKICVQELMSTTRVRSFQPIREEEVSALVNYLHSASGTPVNLSEKILSMVYGFTAKAAFGMKCKDEKVFIENVNESIKLTGGLTVSELFPSLYWLQRISGSGVWPVLEKRLKRLDRILDDIIDNGRAERAVTRAEDSTKGHSFLDVLLDIQEKGEPAIPMETSNIRAIVLDMFVGGGDTSSATLESAMYELSRNPSAMETAQSEVRRVFGENGKIDETRLHELKYLKFVIKETLRMHPPGPLIPRESKESCVINGYNIPAKTKVLVNAWAIGRDPKYWSDPDEFYPERFIDSTVDVIGTDFELIPFGAGRRMCPGFPFAMPNIEFSLAHMLLHFDWKLPDKNADGIETFGMTIRLKDGLHLIPISRSNAFKSIIAT